MIFIFAVQLDLNTSIFFRSVFECELKMSERTLQRRLDEGGTTLRDLVEGVRKEAAQVLLADERLALTDVSARLGFSEFSAFARWFRRWSGVTPTQWRARRNSSPRNGPF